jgi:hypothetical protein
MLMLDIRRIAALQEACVARWHDQPVDNPCDAFMRVVCEQLQFNFLLWHEEDKARDPAAQNTETLGSTIDRLGILSLRVYHLREQMEREDVDEAHRENVGRKLYVATVQHDDLVRAAQALSDDLAAGRKRHQTVRQLKMYNDPALNPYLYKQTAGLE